MNSRLAMSPVKARISSGSASLVSCQVGICRMIYVPFFSQQDYGHTGYVFAQMLRIVTRFWGLRLRGDTQYYCYSRNIIQVYVASHRRPVTNATLVAFYILLILLIMLVMVTFSQPSRIDYSHQYSHTPMLLIIIELLCSTLLVRSPE